MLNKIKSLTHIHVCIEFTVKWMSKKRTNVHEHVTNFRWKWTKIQNQQNDQFMSFHFIKEHPFNVSRTEKFFGILIRWLLRNNIIFKYEYCILWFRYTYVFAWDFYFFLLSPLIYNLCGILHVCEMLFFGEMCALVCIYAIFVWCNKKWENTKKTYTNSIR